MLTDLSIGRGDGSYNKLLANMTKPDLLILDDFGLKQIDLALSHDLLEVIEERHHACKSTAISAQLPVKDWPSVFKDATVSDNTITSTGSSANKAGSVMGTIGAAGQSATAGGETKQGGVAVAATTSGNAVTSAATTITTIYGRQGSPTGMLEVTGGTYEANPIEDNVAYAAPAEGYIIKQNDDGTYGLVELPAVSMTVTMNNRSICLPYII